SRSSRSFCPPGSSSEERSPSGTVSALAPGLKRSSLERTLPSSESSPPPSTPPSSRKASAAPEIWPPRSSPSSSSNTGELPPGSSSPSPQRQDSGYSDGTRATTVFSPGDSRKRYCPHHRFSAPVHHNRLSSTEPLSEPIASRFAPFRSFRRGVPLSLPPPGNAKWLPRHETS